jgi:PAS domain S-box-containing protein
MPDETPELDPLESSPSDSLLCPQCEIVCRRLEETLNRNTALFNALLSHSRDAILLTGPDGRIVHVARSISAYGSKELDGTPVESLIYADDREIIHDCYRRLLNREESSIDVEVRGLLADGSFVWIEATFTDMLDHPDVQAIICNYRDITIRKEHELAMAEFEAIVQSSGYAIFSTDADGKTLTWNRGAEKQLGFTCEDLLAKSFLPMVPDEARELALTNVRAVFETRIPCDFQAVACTKDGRALPVTVHLAPILDSKGRTRGVSHMFMGLPPPAADPPHIERPLGSLRA